MGNMDSIRNILIASTMLLAACTWVEARTLTGAKTHYTKAHHALHRLVQDTTHTHLQEFEIAVPELVDDEGNFLSRSLHHSLARRSIRSSPVLKLTAHGYDFRVKLLENDLLLAPSFAVKRIRRDANTDELREHEETSNGAKCHYMGRMISHENRATGISLCGHGASGLLRTMDDDFVIEPVSPDLHHSFPGEQQPHVVYKRKHMGKGKQKLHYCGRNKQNPTVVSADLDAQIQQFSYGLVALKSPDLTKNKYETTDNNEHAPLRRWKRATDSFSAEKRKRERRRVVETWVVADRQLVKNHENDRVDVATYILTVMNMVASLFKDGTLDDNIEIALVGITLLESDEELDLDHRADKSLSNFCNWQAKANATNGRKPDHSILLTGVDICIDRNAPCDTLGLAQIGGMCSRSDSCTINEDIGLGLAFTVAHETGHSFGMKHDGQGNLCSKGEGHIMSPTMNNLNGVFTWSSCSRNSLQQFLKSDRAICLDDAPASSQYGQNHKLPGETYNSRDQCQLQFGKGVTVCHFRHFGSQQKSICKALWCQRRNGVCETKSLPAVEGTSCGRNMWCRRGECVSRNSSGPRAINGGWSVYGSWSECSRTCGGGVKSRKRSCDSPIPRYGGRYCEGRDTTYELCNAGECPSSVLDFRAQQCAEYNGRPYRKKFFNWVPHKKYWKYDFNRCELMCEAEGYNFFDRLASQVKDGTSCDDESKDVCVAGQCVRVGCDNRLNSNATLDSCGICNGDNSTCRFVKGTFEDVVSDSGYYEVTRIPHGASTIQIAEVKCCTHTYIAVKSAKEHTRYYLNGNWRIDLYGEMTFAGAKWQYKRQPLRGEVLETDGPIIEELIVEALIVRRNPGITFKYAEKEIDNTLPHDMLVASRSYSWQEQRSNCSKPCAAGEQDITYVCMGDGLLSVPDSFCRVRNKPKARRSSCNTGPCPAGWVVEDWSKCSRTCGGGLQTRRVTCQRLTSSGEEYVSPRQCDLKNKPRRNKSCFKNRCPPVWKTGSWSRCSRQCGSGIRTRTISCLSGRHKILEGSCNQTSKPHSSSVCLVSYCRRRFQWFITAWGECSTHCGGGLQTRRLKCTFKNRSGRYKPVNPRRCSRTRRPRISLSKSCVQKACSGTLESVSSPPPTLQQQTTTISRLAMTTKISRFDHVTTKHHGKPESKRARWVAASWSECPVTCGGARQVRFVGCVSRGMISDVCVSEVKPRSERACNTNMCPVILSTNEPPCEDAYTWCYMVPQHHQCSHKLFGSQCCKSCRGA